MQTFGSAKQQPAQHDRRQTHLTELRGTCEIGRNSWTRLAVHVASSRFVGTNHNRSISDIMVDEYEGMKPRISSFTNIEAVLYCTS